MRSMWCRGRLVFFYLSMQCLSVFALEPQYQLGVKLDPIRRGLRASQMVSFAVPEGANIDDVCFHVYPNRRYTSEEINDLMQFAERFKSDVFVGKPDTGQFSLLSVKVDGQSERYAFEGSDQTLLRVQLAAPRKTGEKIEVALEYQMEVPEMLGRFGCVEGVFSLSRFYPQLCPYENGKWQARPFYPLHQPFYSESSSYDVRFSCPIDMVVASTGSQTVEKVSSESKIVRIRTERARDFTLAASTRYQVKERLHQGTSLRCYFLPGDEAGAERALQYAASTMEFYGQRLGNYTPKQFTIAEIYLGYGGNEASEIIFIDRRAFRFPFYMERYLDFLVSHETGHQWWFNVVGSDEFKETFMDEGINSYFDIRYLESKYGRKENVFVWPRWLKWLPNTSFRDAFQSQYLLYAKYGLDEQVLKDIDKFEDPVNILAMAYGKGAGALLALTAKIGQEKLDDVFSKYYEKYSYKNGNTADFFRLVEAETGQNMSSFVNAWLLRASFVDVGVSKFESIRQNDGRFETTVKVFRHGEALAPVTVQVTDKAGVLQQKEWAGTSSQDVIAFTTDAEVVRVDVDPSDSVVDVNRVNNHCPKEWNLRLTPFYFFAYDLPYYDPNQIQVTAGPAADSGLGGKVSVQTMNDFIAYLSAGYNSGDQETQERLGLELKHFAGTSWDLGIEGYGAQETADEENTDNTLGGKVFVRKKFYPIYSSIAAPDHLTLYLSREIEIGEGKEALQERIEGFDYEYPDDTTFLGASLHWRNTAPTWHPRCGWMGTVSIEHGIVSGESKENTLSGGTNSVWGEGFSDSFTRGMVDASTYFNTFGSQVLALRGKCGIGDPGKVALFTAGGSTGLRGYDDDFMKGSHLLAGAIEYRVPVASLLRWGVLDNTATFSEFQVVGFVESGKAWFDDYDSVDFISDAGIGFRAVIDLLGMLERATLRVDVAKPFDEDEKGEKSPHFFVGLGQTF